MNFSAYYKKAWESSLSERTTELIAEIKTIRAQNARYREALEHYESAHYDSEGRPCMNDQTAYKALKGVE